MPDTLTIHAPQLTQFAASLLKAGGFTEAEGKATATSLVQSNLLGYDSHGVNWVPQYIKELESGELRSAVTLDVFKDAPNSMIADARRGLGQVQMPRFLSRMLAKIKENGVVSGALRNCGHTGRIGEWSDHVAKLGYIAFIAVNVNGHYRFVAPPGGKEGRTSTNPFSFALPLKNGETFMIDVSTSATAMGKVWQAKLAGQQVPQGHIQDADGTPTTDPNVMWADPKGALLPMGGDGGYKGFALSMIIDLLAAGMSGGLTPPAPDNTAHTNNVSITIWNPSYFAGAEHMATEAEKYMTYLRTTTPIDPSQPIRLPGDHSRAQKIHRTENGIPLSLANAQALAKIAQSTNTPIPAEFQGVL